MEFIGATSVGEITGCKLLWYCSTSLPLGTGMGSPAACPPPSSVSVTWSPSAPMSPLPDGLSLQPSQLHPNSPHFLWSSFIWCICMYLCDHSWNETKIIRKTYLSLFIMSSYLAWEQLSCNKHVRLDYQGPSMFCWLGIQRPGTLNYMPWSTCCLLQTLDAMWIEL